MHVVDSIMIESQILFEADHPNICNMSYFFESEQRLYFAMPMIQGGEMKRLIKSKRIKEKQIKIWAVQILKALEYLYANKVLHRDLKPDNILLDEDGYVQIIDFGLSKQLQSNQEKSGTQCGSPQYMAPEHFVGTGHSHTADYWSVGIILYEMLAGTVPFANNQSEEAVRQIIFPSGKTNESSVEFRNLIKKLLVFNPSDRIGHLEGPKEILADAWFADVDQEKILSRSEPCDDEYKPKKFDWDPKKKSEYFQLKKGADYLQQSRINKKGQELINQNKTKFDKFAEVMN